VRSILQILLAESGIRTCEPNLFQCGLRRRWCYRPPWTIARWVGRRTELGPVAPAVFGAGEGVVGNLQQFPRIERSDRI
jgi:hypothetical protein